MKKQNYIWLIVLAIGAIWIISRHAMPQPYQHNKGLIFGTVYNITYQHSDDLKQEIDNELKRFDASLSMFNDTSTISRINRNEDIAADSLLTIVFNKAMEVSKATNGSFDITVAPLVNAWGFGFKQGEMPSKEMVDSLLQLVGYNKVSMLSDGKIKKQDPNIMLDCSAIAKGFAVDVIAKLLKDKGIKNYLVDIGGEVDVAGVNPESKLWRIGINKPTDDSLSLNQELQTILSISDIGMATSGNYRNFYYKGGKKYAHTIDPKSGYPVQHSLLSATVIAKDCMTADAYATSFMVMGVEKAKAIADNNPNIEAYFIYSTEDGAYQTVYSKGMEKYITK